jgi:Flp pilus assembly protein TadD
LALWRDNVVKNPNCYAVHNNLAIASMDAGRLADAEVSAIKAVALAPDEWVVCQTHADVLHRRGKFGASIREYERELRLQPHRAEELQRVIDDIRRTIRLQSASLNSTTQPTN